MAKNTALKHLQYSLYVCALIGCISTVRIYFSDYYVPVFILLAIARSIQYLYTIYFAHPLHFESLEDVNDYLAAARKKLPNYKEGWVTVRDGTRIYYERVGHGQKVVALANGLGAREWSWLNFMHKAREENLFSECTFILWGYRGLFMSGPPPPGKHSVRDHADDLLDLMRIFGVPRLHAIWGWSTGAQVGLQFAAMYGERVDRLVLMNGAHGHTLHSALQPVLPIPFMGEALQLFVHYIRTLTPSIWTWIGRQIYSYQTFFRWCIRPYAVLHGNPVLEWATLLYFADAFDFHRGQSDKHTLFLLQTFQELDAHSAFHLLPEIRTKTLIIGGFCDFLTPVYHSFAMNARMPDARLLCYFFGTHFTCFEFPQSVSREVIRFLQEPAQNPYLPLTDAATPTEAEAKTSSPSEWDQEWEKQGSLNLDALDGDGDGTGLNQDSQTSRIFRYLPFGSPRRRRGPRKAQYNYKTAYAPVLTPAYRHLDSPSVAAAAADPLLSVPAPPSFSLSRAIQPPAASSLNQSSSMARSLLSPEPLRPHPVVVSPRKGDLPRPASLRNFHQTKLQTTGPAHAGPSVGMCGIQCDHLINLNPYCPQNIMAHEHAVHKLSHLHKCRLAVITSHVPCSHTFPFTSPMLTPTATEVPPASPQMHALSDPAGSMPGSRSPASDPVPSPLALDRAAPAAAREDPKANARQRRGDQKLFPSHVSPSPSFTKSSTGEEKETLAESPSTDFPLTSDAGSPDRLKVEKAEREREKENPNQWMIVTKGRKGQRRGKGAIIKMSAGGKSRETLSSPAAASSPGPVFSPSSLDQTVMARSGGGSSVSREMVLVPRDSKETPAGGSSEISPHTLSTAAAIASSLSPATSPSQHQHQHRVLKSAAGFRITQPTSVHASSVHGGLVVPSLRWRGGDRTNREKERSPEKGEKEKEGLRSRRRKRTGMSDAYTRSHKGLAGLAHAHPGWYLHAAAMQAAAAAAAAEHGKGGRSVGGGRQAAGLGHSLKGAPPQGFLGEAEGPDEWEDVRE